MVHARRAERKILRGHTLEPRENLFSSMKTELERNRKKLHLEEEVKPYYLAVALTDTDSWHMTASLGTLMHRGDLRFRSIQANLRVGSYELDNTGFHSIYPQSQSASVPFEYNDLAIRRGIFFAFDQAYKAAIQMYSQKNAYLRNHPRENMPPDWTRVTPLSVTQVGHSIELSADEWLPVIKEASAVFRKYPAIQSSSVSISASNRMEYLLTSEKQKSFTSDGLLSIIIAASGQAEDGTAIYIDWRMNLTPDDEYPEREKIIKAAHETVSRLSALLDAPKIDENYSGPVIFEGKAAVDFVVATLAPALASNPPPVTWSQKGVFENMIGRMILPPWVDIVDDPGMKSHLGKTLAGNYEVDDEGVRAERLELVKRGRLMGFLASRRPSKDAMSSNGRGRGIFGSLNTVAAPSNFILTSRKKLNRKAMKNELLKLVRKRGLKYGYIVRRSQSFGSFLNLFSDARNLRLPNPIEMYRVDLKGRETLVRGAQLAPIPVSELERIVAMGGGPEVANIRMQPGFGVSIVTPDILVERIEISETPMQPQRKPLLSSPLAGVDSKR